MNQFNTQEAKVALVTGGARRIGAAIVGQFHQAGYKVAIHCHRSLSEAEALCSALNASRPDSALVLQAELTQTESAQNLIDAVVHWAGRLDVLVNNASIFQRNDCEIFNLTQWDALFDSNLKAPWLLSLAAYPFLKTQQGTIINLTDVHAEKPLKDYAIYSQTKAALEMQTKALAREFAPEVRVNGVAPGAIIWPEHENSLSITMQQEIIERTPLARHGSPEHIAQAVLALAENYFVTGQLLKVDGGRSLIG